MLAYSHYFKSYLFYFDEHIHKENKNHTENEIF